MVRGRLMQLLPIIGIALTGTVLYVLLKQYKPEYAMLAALACSVLIFLTVIQQLSPVFSSLNELLSLSSVGGIYTKSLLKALGICYLVQLASDSCKDAGQASIAGKVEFAGKAAVLLISLPLFQNLASAAVRLIRL